MNEKVGSSLLNLSSAFLILLIVPFLEGFRERETTGSGIKIDYKLTISELFLTKVVPESHSTPNNANISPALAFDMSIISLACIYTILEIFTFLLSFVLIKVSPFLIFPEYTLTYVN